MLVTMLCGIGFIALSLESLGVASALFGLAVLILLYA
jgi:hypothetical protein